MDIFNQLRGLSKSGQRALMENRLNALKKEIETQAAGEVLDRLLYLLLEAMALLFYVNSEYRKNIKDFNASYVIQSQDGKIDVSAVFKKVSFLWREMDGMEVKSTVMDHPTTSVTFRDGKAMAEFLFSGNPDVIQGMLNNQLSVSGNLNYLFKFIYLILLIPEILGIEDFTARFAPAA